MGLYVSTLEKINDPYNVSEYFSLDLIVLFTVEDASLYYDLKWVESLI